MPVIGEQLRAARIARGKSLQDVQADLHIREKYLEALEEEKFQVIPGIVYAKGFLRSYARYLGLDEDALIAQLPEAPIRPEDATREQRAPSMRAPLAPLPARRPSSRQVLRRKPARQWPWVVVPLVFLVALLYYFGLPRHAPSTGSAPHHTTSPPKSKKGGGAKTGGSTGGTQGNQAALTPQTATTGYLGGPQANYSAAKGPISATLTLSGPCWVYVQQDGVTVMEATQTGGTFTFSANQSLVIKVGDPVNAALQIDGQNIPLSGANAESVGVQVQG